MENRPFFQKSEIPAKPPCHACGRIGDKTAHLPVNNGKRCGKDKNGHFVCAETVYKGFPQVVRKFVENDKAVFGQIQNRPAALRQSAFGNLVEKLSESLQNL